MQRLCAGVLEAVGGAERNVGLLVGNELEHLAVARHAGDARARSDRIESIRSVNLALINRVEADSRLKPNRLEAIGL
jgi:hypothetical protein